MERDGAATSPPRTASSLRSPRESPPPAGGEDSWPQLRVRRALRGQRVSWGNDHEPQRHTSTSHSSSARSARSSAASPRLIRSLSSTGLFAGPAVPADSSAEPDALRSTTSAGPRPAARQRAQRAAWGLAALSPAAAERPLSLAELAALGDALLSALDQHYEVRPARRP